MRSKLVSAAFGALVALAALAPSTARAEEQFDVSVEGGKVVVKTKGDWHINKEYPWKLDATGGFSLGEKEASLANAPKGKHTLKGAVCSGATCLPFKKDVEVK